MIIDRLNVRQDMKNADFGFDELKLLKMIIKSYLSKSVLRVLYTGSFLK